MKKNVSQSKPNSSKAENTPSAGGELHQIADQDHPSLTTNQGVRISDNQNTLKAIAYDPGGKGLLKAANIGEDAGVVVAAEIDAFLAAAKTRQWEREKHVRMLA